MPIVGVPAGPAGGTAVPTDGTFSNANWSEVFGTDHDFTGRTILTNGLLLLDCQTAQTRLARIWLWNTAIATPAWSQVADLAYYDNAANVGTLRQITTVRVGAEESALALVSSTAGNQSALHTIRLQRGRYEGRVDFRPLTQAAATTGSLRLIGVAQPKILFNSASVGDNSFENTSVSPTDFGYGGGFTNSANYPWLLGFTYQNQPGGVPPVSSSGYLALNDTTSLAINAQRSYGFFATPYGVNGSYSTANLQAEAETGTLGTGWTSQANAAASAGNEAKCASGTVATNADIFGTAFTPPSGFHDVWFRMKVTTNVGSSAEMTVGLWDSVGAAFVAGASTTFNRTALTTSYAWYRAGTAFALGGATTVRFRAVTALTLGTDWFIDEAVLIPKQLTATNNGPQDIAQQFSYDRSTRWIRP